MKKFIQISIFLFISAFSFGQSTTILPSNVDNNSFSNNNFKVESSHNFLGFSAIRFNPTLSVVKNPVLSGNNILTLGGGGHYNTTNDIHFSKARIAFTATENYSATASGSKMSFFTTPNGSITPAERMTINHDGKVGIGTASPNYKLQIHEPTAGSSTSLLLTNADAGSNPFDGLRISLNPIQGIFDLAASITNSENAGLYFGTNNLTRIAIDETGKVGIGTTVPSTELDIIGFTKLGAGAPKIKMKKLTGTTNAAQGGFVNIAHGVVNPSKIISVNVLVRYNGANADAWVGNGYTSAVGYEFDYQYEGPNVIVYNKAGNSSAILSKDIKVVITYEE